ncbi:MAG: hypothetical protein R3247_07935, partial [Rhodothermales bacterium]|nr:hypothetical protein [Rhodothermales bacterium]
MKTIACNAPYGRGGLGQHLRQVVEDARAKGLLRTYYAHTAKPGDAAGTVIDPAPYRRLARYTPLRFRAGWRNYLIGDLFDRAVARRLGEPLPVFVGFGGKALHSFRRAR